MGQLLYGSTPVVLELDDRVLAHLEAVVLAKLRRNEPFSVTVPFGADGRRTVWLSPASTLVFEFATTPPALERPLLDEYLDGANANGGLRLL